MYTIREAAVRAGVPVATLRAWERRYGVVQPSRTAAAYRLYSEADLELLRAMRRLVEAGWAPSVAAAALLRGDPEARDAAAGDEALPAEPLTPRADLADELVERFIRAAGDLDQEGVAAALDEMLARATFERAAEDLLLPALRRLGAAWAAGALSVAAEHAASHAVLRRLAGAFEAAGRAGDERRPIVVALPPGSRHELGALAFAVAARRAGLPVAYLGADLPAEDWRSACASALAAVIAVPTEADLEPAAAIARRLRRGARDARAGSGPRLVVAVGGAGARDLPGVLRLPDDLAGAVATLRAELGSVAGATTSRGRESAGR